MVAGLVATALVLGGCGQAALGRYQVAVTQNQQALQQLRLGMSSAEVFEVMGEGDIVQYNWIQFVDPWRSESFTLADGTNVLIVFYLTQQVRKRRPQPRDDNLTPIVLENDRVMGWGWSYLRRNTERYRVGTPKEQK